VPTVDPPDIPDGPATGQTCTTNGIKNAPIDDPRHYFNAPAADVIEGQSKTYSIRGGSDHNHDITLGPDHFQLLRQGRSVTVRSTFVADHDHQVTVICA
jgi:hypothetical protein